MKIGIVSDIHAYLQPLNIALQIFEREKVDQIICAGDLVDGGDEPNAVIQRIQRLGIPCVQGNHDTSALEDPWWEEEEILPNDPYSKYRLTADSREFLAELPSELDFEFEGKTLYLTHGAPWGNWEYIFPYTLPRIIKRVVEHAATDIVILGHTHMPMQLICGATMILNAGSVAYNRDNFRERSCGVLEIPDLRFRIFDLATGKSKTLAPVVI